MRSLRSIPTALLSLGARRVNLSPPVFHLLYPWHDDTVAAVLSALRIDKPLVMIVLRVRACTSAPHCLRREGGGGRVDIESHPIYIYQYELEGGTD